MCITNFIFEPFYLKKCVLFKDHCCLLASEFSETLCYVFSEVDLETCSEYQ
jgi:hypothetical protein